MAVVAPMPIASVRNAMNENAGVRSRMRAERAVSPQRGEELEAVQLAHGLLVDLPGELVVGLGVTEPAPDLRLGVVARHARGDELLDPFLDVEAELVIERPVDPALSEGKLDAAAPGPHRHRAPSAAITIATASV